MKSTWIDVISLFRNYFGEGLISVWYLASVLYLYVREKRREVRIVFVYAPIILLLVYFNPLFAWVVYYVAGYEIYYRLLWLLPMTAVIAYTCCSIYGSLQGKKKGAFAVGMAALLALSGSFIYANPFFHKAENRYHMPDSVVVICDAIRVPGREVQAAFPAELLQFVRQYSPVVCMPYGREMLVERWQQSNDLFDAMEMPQADLEVLAPLATEYSCHYVIIRRDKPLVGQPEAYQWELFLETGPYAVYRNLEVPLVIPEGY